MQTSNALDNAASSPWIVLKFGGTSVSTRARWDNIGRISLAERAQGRRVLLVVSALTGVTDILKALCDAPAEKSWFEKLVQQHAVLLADMQMVYAMPQTQAEIAAIFEDLKRHLVQVPALGESDATRYAWQAELMSFGERLSSTLGAHYLRAAGNAIGWLDARTQLRALQADSASDWSRYLSVNCDAKDGTALAQALDGSAFWITQGFVARNSQGETVILGRGGSDTSASYFGQMLRAIEVQIWTDVPGMFSANPKRVPDARLLQLLDFDEAQEIAATGAKVLHPRCLLPVREAEILLRIKDTERPELPGTLIGPARSSSSPSVKAVSIRSGITLVSMESLGMWQQVGFLADVFAQFKAHGLSIDLIGSSETNITVSLDPSDNLLSDGVLQHLCEDLAKVCRVKVIAPCSALTLVGRGIRSILHRLSEVCAEVGAGRVHLLTQSSNDLNLTFVVDEARADALLPAVHQCLINARLLPLDDPQVIGPSWTALNQVKHSVGESTEPWWRTHRHLLCDLGQRGPQFVCALPAVRQRLLELKDIRAVDEWYYAMKANAAPAILQEMIDADFGIECVSQAEIEYVIAHFPTLPRTRILFSPNFAPREEYACAIALGVQLSLDSTFALAHWPELVRGQSVHLRLDLGFGGGHHAKVNTGGDRSKFGLALADLTTFERLARELDLRIIGLHAHLGSGIRDIEHWPRVLAELASIADRRPDIRTLNLGGGLGVPQHEDEQRLDFSALNAKLLALRAHYPQFKVRMEPGRYPVAESTVLLTRVTQSKSKGAGMYIGVDTGMNSLIRPALYDAYHPIVNLTRLDEPAQPLPCTVVGPICESGDVLGEARRLPNCEEGDVILIAQAGAYGAVMSSHYNLRSPAREVFLSAEDLGWEAI